MYYHSREPGPMICFWVVSLPGIRTGGQAPLLWMQYFKNTLREFLQALQKCPLWLKDELIRLWKSEVTGRAPGFMCASLVKEVKQTGIKATGSPLWLADLDLMGSNVKVTVTWHLISKLSQAWVEGFLSDLEKHLCMVSRMVILTLILCAFVWSKIYILATFFLTLLGQLE